MVFALPPDEDDPRRWRGDTPMLNITDDRLRLLYDLVLLEYNSYWWRSHPLVRTLAGRLASRLVLQLAHAVELAQAETADGGTVRFLASDRTANQLDFDSLLCSHIQTPVQT